MRVVTVILGVLAGGALLAGGAYAVGSSAFDRWTDPNPNAPQRIGERVEVATTDDSTVYAWRSNRGICMGISVHDDPEALGCGMPVIGAGRDTGSTQPPQQVVGFLASSPGVDDTSTYVFGPTSPTVARVAVELHDGRVLETQTTAAPDGLDTQLRFYALQIPNAQPTQTAPGETPTSPIKAVRAYDAAGVRLGSIIMPTERRP